MKNGEDIVENFDYTKLPSIGETPRLAAYMTDILSREFIVNYQVRPVIDDRMYTLCYIAKDGKAADLHHYGYRDDERASDFWYRFIYVDGEEITCFSPEMKKRLIEEATYDRWMDHPEGCSLYGISRYDFMLYSSHGLLHTHLRTIYFKMAILALAQRATILRFSDEITEILSGHSKKIAERSSQLYFDYIYFINRLHFREVTPQEQGIELYDMMMKQMQIEKQLKELDGEIAELHNYVQMENEEKRNSRLEFISKLGAIFLPPSLLAGIYGMNSIEFTKDYPFLALLTLLIASAVGACFVFECHTKRISLKTIKSLIAIIVFIALLFIPYCFTKENSTPKEKGESCLQKIFKSDVPSNSTPR